MPAGAVIDFAGQAAIPSGWLFCDGSQYNVSDYPALFAAISNAYGGDGSSTFNVPDYRSNFLYGFDERISGQKVGDKGGEATHVLTPDELASHSHLFSYYLTSLNAGALGSGGPIVLFGT